MKFKSRGERKLRCNRIKLPFLYALASVVLTGACSMSPACSSAHGHNSGSFAASDERVKSSVNTTDAEKIFTVAS